MRVSFALLLLVGWTLPAVFAADIAKEARKKEAEKRFVKLKDYCKERRVTHIVELLAEWGEFAGQPQQDEVVGMAEAIFKDAQAELKAGGAKGGTITFPEVGRRGVSADADLVQKATFASAYFVNEYRTGRPPNRPATPQDALDVARQQVVVAARTLSVRANDPAEDCVLLTNATTAGFLELNKCVVLASGDLELDSLLIGSVVVCRGNITFRFGLGGKESSLVRAGGTVTDVRAAKLAPQGVPAPQPDGKRVFSKDTKLLDVRFYSSAEDGLEVAEAKNVLTVSKLDEAKPFAKAGAKNGDVVEKVNGEKVQTQHELDRLLCRATVSSGVAKMTVKRGEKSEVIEVKLADW